MDFVKVDKRGRISLVKIVKGIMPKYYSIDQDFEGKIILTAIYDFKALEKGIENLGKDHETNLQ